MGLPIALVLPPDEPVARRALERHAGTNPLERAAARVGEDRLERRLRLAAVVVAGRRSAVVGPLGPEQLLDLAHAAGRGRIGRAVLGVPDPAAPALHALDVAGDGG